MIGVLCREEEREIVREFFELFKTPWEFYAEGRGYDVLMSTGLDFPSSASRLRILYSARPTSFDSLKDLTLVPSAPPGRYIDHRGDLIELPIYGGVAHFRHAYGLPILREPSGSETSAIRFSEPRGSSIRVGYDLFREVDILLSEGQPPSWSLIPTLEVHLSLLRSWILDAGIPLIEVPPVPWGHTFISCLTHDVDFAGIRFHKFDHTMWGFCYRATFGSFLRFLKGTCSLPEMMKNWLSVLSVPLVFMGLARDFWDDYDRYSEMEAGSGSTYFFVPFKKRAGDEVDGERPRFREVRYDLEDLSLQIAKLTAGGSEIGLHGIDAWRSPEKGKLERDRILEVTTRETRGVRMHWLLFDKGSASALDRAGFDYDSTVGYNETIGFRNGSTQVYRPLGASRLLELPLHIQDTALFYPGRLALTQAQAWDKCGAVIRAAARFGGVITLSWHQRSLGPERQWGGFYLKLLRELKTMGVWFGTAGRVVDWFRQRRSLSFERCDYGTGTVRLKLKSDGKVHEPPMSLRIHRPRRTGPDGSEIAQDFVEVPWLGESYLEIPVN